jgi:hypothetical protein
VCLPLLESKHDPSWVGRACWGSLGRSFLRRDPQHLLQAGNLFAYGVFAYKASYAAAFSGNFLPNTRKECAHRHRRVSSYHRPEGLEMVTHCPQPPIPRTHLCSGRICLPVCPIVSRSLPRLFYIVFLSDLLKKVLTRNFLDFLLGDCNCSPPTASEHARGSQHLCFILRSPWLFANVNKPPYRAGGSKSISGQRRQENCTGAELLLPAPHSSQGWLSSARATRAHMSL